MKKSLKNIKIKKYGDGGKVSSPVANNTKELHAAYLAVQDSVNQGYKNIDKYKSAITNVRNWALNSGNYYDAEFHAKVVSKLRDAGVPLSQCIFTATDIVNRARKQVGMPPLKGAGWTSNNTIGKPLVENRYIQNTAFQQTHDSEGFAKVDSNAVVEPGDYIQQHDNKGKAFHSFVVTESQPKDKTFKAVMNTGHGEIVERTYPTSRFGKNGDFYHYKPTPNSEDFNSLVKRRNNIAAKLNAVDPSILNPQITPFYKDYNKESLKMPDDRTTTQGDYVRSLQAHKKEIMSHWNISNEEYDKLADLAYRIPTQETKWGNGTLYKLKSDFPNVTRAIKGLTGDSSSETQLSTGLGRVKYDALDAKTKDFLSTRGINQDKFMDSNFDASTSALITMAKLTNDYRHTLNSEKFPRNTEDRYKETIYKYKGIKHEADYNDYVARVNAAPGLKDGKATNYKDVKTPQANIVKMPDTKDSKGYIWGSTPIVKPVVKYGEGGKIKPIVVNDPNDPRLKAYQDSLSLYNLTNDGLIRYQTKENKGFLPISSNDASIKFQKIKPINLIDFGDVKLANYKKPVQPVVYQPKTNTAPKLKEIPKVPLIQSKGFDTNKSIPPVYENYKATVEPAQKSNFQPYTAAGYPMIGGKKVPKGYINRGTPTFKDGGIINNTMKSLKDIKIASRRLKKYEYGGVTKPNYLLSGLSGAASGATAGATIAPPWGAVVGGVLGGAMSLIGSKKGYNQALEAKKIGDANNMLQEYEDNKYGKIAKDMAGQSFRKGGKVKSRRIANACKSKK